MKLLFDARWIKLDRHDGISRYTTELANALVGIYPDIIFIVSHPEQKKFIPNATFFVDLHPVDSWKEPFSSLLLNKHHPDLVFSPMQTMGSFGRKFKLILTLHDLIYYKHRLPPPSAKGIVRPLWRLYHLSYWPQRFALNSADMTATVSETSKQEILDAKLTNKRLIVISNAARDLTRLLKTPVRQYDTPPKNLVFMGTPLPYKNVELLIDMMQFLPGRRLHILSKISVERKKLLSTRIPTGADVQFHNGVSDEEYAELLANDAIMVSASLAEGYGLPLAEALQLGVPAVVSHRPYFREIAADNAAVFADPTNAKEFALAIRQLDDPIERKRRIAAGKEAVNRFSWEKSAEILLEECSRLLR